MTVTASAPDTKPLDLEPEQPRSVLRRMVSNPGRVWAYVGIPVVVAVSWTALYFWVTGLELDSIEARWLNADVIQRTLTQHIRLSLTATLFVVVIAVPLGMLLTRPIARRITPFFIGLANIGQAIPSIGLIFFLSLPFLLGFGAQTAIVAVVAYCILPVLRNTMVGLQQVDQALIEAARGMGMSRSAVLLRIETPLAVPVMLAGVRTALILAVGTMALATFINGGGLGDIINAGIVNRREPILITGAVLTAGLALVIDWIASIAEEVLRPRGL